MDLLLPMQLITAICGALPHMQLTRVRSLLLQTIQMLHPAIFISVS
jgi:hypothetical protein